MRHVRCLLVLLYGMFTAGAALAEPVTVTDIIGRTVTLPGPAKRIVLAQARQLNALALIHKDPMSVLAGWGSDYLRQNPDAYAIYQKTFPAIGNLPVVGDGNSADGFSFEKAVVLDPDLVILSLSIAGPDGQAGGLVAKLEAAGIPVAVVDFFIHPLRDTVPSLRILGRLTGREAAAEEYIHFYEQELHGISARLEGAPRPSVFIHAHAGGRDCCFTPGKGSLNDFINAAGGVNIAASLVSGATGQVSLEQLIANDPQIYVATGGIHLRKSGGLVLGLGVEKQEADTSFAALVSQPGLEHLTSIREKRAFGLWHLFNDTPAHIVAIQQLAKWLHPERFGDVDPERTLKDISARFSAIPLEGTFWVGAADTAPGGQAP